MLEFITDMTQKGMEIGRSGRVQVEDMIFLVRKQPKMYARTRVSTFKTLYYKSIVILDDDVYIKYFLLLRTYLP